MKKKIVRSGYIMLWRFISFTIVLTFTKGVGTRTALCCMANISLNQMSYSCVNYF